MPGAGHGSTMWDLSGNLWHTSTMRISVNHQFERRVGIWRAGFDADGELFCNQRYGDWPVAVSEKKTDAWENPQWYLLSYKKSVEASSYEKGKEPALAVDEDATTWWQSGTKDGWLKLDLQKNTMSVPFRLTLQTIKSIFRCREKLREPNPAALY